MGHQPTILVVDDEVHIVNVVVMNFKRAGYNVLVARGPQEAFETACAQLPDLIITDHNMPGGSGIDLCRLLHSEPATAAIPAILLTAYDFSIVEKQLGDSNVCAVMPKPFSPRELLSRVQGILETAVNRQD